MIPPGQPTPAASGASAWLGHRIAPAIITSRVMMLRPWLAALLPQHQVRLPNPRTLVRTRIGGAEPERRIITPLLSQETIWA